MELSNLEFSWADLVVVIVLCVGVARGRRRGMSQELLDVLKWLLVVLLAGHYYEPLGSYFAENSVFSLLSCYVAAYSLLALSVFLVISIVRRVVGQKIVSSDAFGRGEYYLGMVGGLIRYGCVVLVALAFINARHYSPQELRAQARYQEDNFGSIAFPTFGSLREEIVQHSLVGRVTTDYLSAVMIRPTAPNEKPLVNNGNIVKARERQVNQVWEKHALDTP
jgi:uncharacterized membrane protein required for colicin V production